MAGGWAQLAAADRGHDRGRLAGDVVAAGALERHADPRGSASRLVPGSGALASSSGRVGGVQVGEGLQRGREVWARAATLTPPASALSAANRMELVGVGAHHVGQHVHA